MLQCASHDLPQMSETGPNITSAPVWEVPKPLDIGFNSQDLTQILTALKVQVQLQGA